MKYLYLIVLSLLMMTPVHGYIYIGTMWDNLNKTNPAPDGMYYKCNNSVKHSCSMYVQVDYTSITGGSGTEESPYILSGCTFMSCACWRTQYKSSDTGCTTCANGALGTQANTPHISTTCSYCEKSQIKTVTSGVTKCSACPSNATCNGTATVTCAKGYYGSSSCTQCTSPGTTTGTGKTVQTDCYIPKNTTGSDTSGSYTYTGDSYWC